MSISLSAVATDGVTAGYTVPLLAATLDGSEGRHGPGLSLASFVH